MNRTGYRFDMMPWKFEFCDRDIKDCKHDPYPILLIGELPPPPEPGRVPAGATHVHILRKFSGERDAREEEKWRSLVKSVARCSHGRIMGDACNRCPGAIAEDRTDRLVGFTSGGKPVRVPERERMDDIRAWIRD